MRVLDPLHAAGGGEALHAGGDLRISHRAKQTVNSALKKLEAEGYLTLSAGADQRSKRVCLTEKGERFVKAHVDRVPEAEAAALGAMTAAERDALIRLTGRYRALFAQKLNCI